MRLRGGFLAALVVVLVGVGAVFAVSAIRHGADQRDARAAAALAHRVLMPANAVGSRECHGDGLVACWSSPQDPRAVAQAVASSMRSAGGHPQVRCDRVPVGVSPTTTSQSCQVIARYGSHATAVFVMPHAQRTSGTPKVAGTLVSVSAE